MGGQLRVLTILITLTTFAPIGTENLWCYECNTDLKNGHKAECNDPYVPGPSMDLVVCPKNEVHHCLKTVVFYRNILVTVRGCVPSREVSRYCQHEEYFPQSNVECFFCQENACNGQESLTDTSLWNSELFLITLIIISKNFIVY